MVGRTRENDQQTTSERVFLFMQSSCMSAQQNDTHRINEWQSLDGERGEEGKYEWKMRRKEVKP